MNFKLISVIMSFHNNEKSIEKSIKSILNQDYKDLELLLILKAVKNIQIHTKM